MIPQGPNITLEPFSLSEDEDPPSLRTSPRKRKEKKIYESEPFQKSLQSKRKKGKEKEHTPSIPDDNDLPLANDLEGIELYQARQSHISKKRRPGRQPDQHPVVGKRLTEDDEIIIVKIALKYQARFGVDSMRRFWMRVRSQYEKIANRSYYSVDRKAKDCLERRHSQLKHETKSGHGHKAREDEWTQIMDDWDTVVQAYKAKKDDDKEAKRKKLRDTKHYNRDRERLNERLGNKKTKKTNEILNISSGISSSSDATDVETNNSTNGESSTDEISHDGLPRESSMPPSIATLRSESSTPIPGPSNINTRTDIDIDNLSEASKLLPQRKKKAPRKQRRERKDRGPVATKEIAELGATMTTYIEHLMKQPTVIPATAPAAPPIRQTELMQGQQRMEEGIKSLSESVGKIQENQVML